MKRNHSINSDIYEANDIIKSKAIQELSNLDSDSVLNCVVNTLIANLTEYKFIAFQRQKDLDRKNNEIANKDIESIKSKTKINVVLR